MYLVVSALISGSIMAMDNSSKMFDLISQHVKIPDAAYKIHHGARIEALINLLVAKEIFTTNEFETEYEAVCEKIAKSLSGNFPSNNIDPLKGLID